MAFKNDYSETSESKKHLNGIHGRKLGGDLTHQNLKKISIFGVFIALYNERVVFSPRNFWKF